MPAGENRNFDLTKEFHQFLDKSPIAATSILNGAFADILSYGTPLYAPNSVGYWGDNPDWKMDNDRYPDVQWTSAIDVISKV